MLFHPRLRKLFVFGGHRKRDSDGGGQNNDFFSYLVDGGDEEEEGAVEIISVGSVGDGGGGAVIPAVGFTQRATMDVERNEIHVMTVGLTHIFLLRNQKCMIFLFAFFRA